MGLALVLGFSVNVHGQPLGFTNLQGETSGSVRQVCGRLATINRMTPLTGDTANLFQVCRSMVQNENDLLDNGLDPTNTRGLDATELGSGFQNIATEETLSPVRIGINSTSGQILTVATRIAVLRGLTPGLASNGSGNQNSYASLNGFGLGGAAGDEDSTAAGTLSGFFNTFGGVGDTAQTATENGSDFNNVGFTAGLDYRVLENLILGLAGGYAHTDIDFDQNLNVSGGDVEADAYGLTLYGTYYLGGFYVDGMFNYGWANYDINRRVFIDSNVASQPVISSTAVADPDGDQWNLSGQVGYNFQHGALSFGPYGRVNYLQVVTDPYSESGASGLNLSIAEQTAISLQSIFGGQVSYSLSQSFGVLMPYLRFDWHHEFKDDSRVLRGVYLNDPTGTSLIARSSSPDRDYFALNTGISGVFAGDIQAYFNYNTILGHDLLSSHLFSIGARMSF